MNLLRPKLLALFLLFAGIVPYSYGQEQQSITPPSPEAAAMMRSINIPVSHYTGTASINIPFYTISAGGVQVPVSLGYQASGIKVKDMEALDRRSHQPHGAGSSGRRGRIQQSFRNAGRRASQ